MLSTCWRAVERSWFHTSFLTASFHTSTVYLRTLQQVIRHGPLKAKPKKQGPMNGQPQLKGIVLQTMILKPRKPNSGQRKCCKVRLSTGKVMTAYIPGEGLTLKEHDVVLIQGGGPKDVPGVKVRVIRGKYDCGHPIK